MTVYRTYRSHEHAVGGQRRMQAAGWSVSSIASAWCKRVMRPGQRIIVTYTR